MVTLKLLWSFCFNENQKHQLLTPYYNSTVLPWHNTPLWLQVKWFKLMLSQSSPWMHGSPLPCSDFSIPMTRQSAKFNQSWPSQRYHRWFYMSWLLFKKARLQCFSCKQTKNRPSRDFFSYQKNYISITVLKRMSIIRLLIQKMRTVPQNV